MLGWETTTTSDVDNFIKSIATDLSFLVNTEEPIASYLMSVCNELQIFLVSL